MYFSQGSDDLGNVEAMKLQGEQNRANVLAAMALVQSAGVPLSDRVIAAALEYPGLPHRCEFVGKHNGVKWINDSKGTNVGATSAAIRGLEGKMILLAGGQSKRADFTPLTAVMRNKVVHAILFGEDANRIGQAVRGACPIHRVDTLKAAVLLAKKLSSKGQSVLFSPACASFDMFQNYQHRGERFKALVKECGRWIKGMQIPRKSQIASRDQWLVGGGGEPAFLGSSDGVFLDDCRKPAYPGYAFSAAIQAFHLYCAGFGPVDYRCPDEDRLAADVRQGHAVDQRIAACAAVDTGVGVEINGSLRWFGTGMVRFQTLGVRQVGHPDLFCRLSCPKPE